MKRPVSSPVHSPLFPSLANWGALLLSAALVTGCADKKEDAYTDDKLAHDIQEADARVRNHKLEDAEKIYDRVLENRPDNPDAIGGLGRVRWEQKKLDEAAQLLSKAAAAKEKDADLYATLGAVYAQQEKHAEAADAYGKAWALDGENSDYGLAYGKHLKETEQYPEAEKVLREVAELDPEVRFVHTELADVLRETGRTDEALKMYMKAQNTYRSDRMARAGAALVYETKGDIQHALDEWSAYIRMDCCSDYSKNVARKKVMELGPDDVELPPLEEGAADGEAAAGDDEAAAG